MLKRIAAAAAGNQFTAELVVGFEGFGISSKEAVMALSEHEQRLLDQLEQQLHADDPKFAHSMASNTGRSMSTRRIVLGSLVTVAGLAVLLLGIWNQFIPVGVAGFLIMGAGVYYATTRSKLDGAAPGAGKAAKASSSPRGSFLSSLEEKWDERKRDQP